MESPRRYKLIACEIMFRELSFCAALSRNIIDVTFLPKGLHDMGERKMSALVQEAIDQVDPANYDAILLGYGLCSNGTRGLRAPIPMVVPRAHDCIALLLGSKERYTTYFDAHPGTYYKSPGWVERSGQIGDSASTYSTDSVMAQLGLNRTFEQYAAKFGEENAHYLMETLGDLVKNYTRLVYIDTQVGDFPHYKLQTQADAQQRGWEYDEVQGDTALLLRLLDGPWSPDEFLVIPPTQTLQPTYDDSVIGLA